MKFKHWLPRVAAIAAFGLGAATKIDSVEVRWPSGLVETFPKVSADKLNELKEGCGTTAK